MKPLWDALSAAGAEVVVSGHDHSYERFAPQTATGVGSDATGVREFIVGTGGVGLRGFGAVSANSEVRFNGAHGALVLVLRPGSYSWDFVPVTGEVIDTGTTACH